MDSREKIQKMLWELFYYLKTKTAIAKALGISDPRLGYWFNWYGQVPYDFVVKIINLLKEYNKDYCAFTENELIDGTVSFCHRLPLSLIGRIALDLKKMAGKRQGKRTDLQKPLPAKKTGATRKDADSSPELRTNSDEVTSSSAKKAVLIPSGRTNDWIAIEVNLKRDTLTYVMKVAETENKALKTAMDSGELSPRQAALAISFSAEKLILILQKSKEERKAYFNTLKNSQNKESLHLSDKAACHVLHDFKEILFLTQARCHCPLYAVYCVLLFVCSDPLGRFQWDISALKVKALPSSSDADFEKMLEELCGCGALKKEQRGCEIEGVIPLYFKDRRPVMH